MAKANTKLITALRHTADKLERGEKYQWGHMGSCNCGNLAQELTQRTKAEIHAYALRTRAGDWAEQVSAFCPNSGLHMDIIIDEMLQAGLSREDLMNLERLADKEVLASLPLEERYLKHNKRADVVKYMRAWAVLLEKQQVENTKQNKEAALEERVNEHELRLPSFSTKATHQLLEEVLV
jgi:hypothetical protein